MRAGPRLHLLRPLRTQMTESGRNSEHRSTVAVSDVWNCLARRRTPDASGDEFSNAPSKTACGISISAASMSHNLSSSAPTRGGCGPLFSNRTCASSCAIVNRRCTGDCPTAQRIRKVSPSRRSSPTTGMSSSSTTSRTLRRVQSAPRSVGGHPIPSSTLPATSRIACSMRSTPAISRSRRAAALFHLTANHTILAFAIRDAQSTSSIATWLSASARIRSTCDWVTSAARRAATLPIFATRPS